MTSPWQKKTLSLCVSAALAHFAVGAVHADSAVGVNTMLGNALNPSGLKTIPALDPEVLDAVPDERTPTGKLLGWPAVVPKTTKTAGGWQYNGEIELGGMWSGGNTNSWWFNQYQDLPDSGVYLNNFYFQAEQLEKGKGYFVEALGGGVGYRDQFEGISFGRYNDWKVKLFYNETPHTFTSTYSNLWSGVGTSYLTLDTLQPGGSRTAVAPVYPRNATAAQITAANTAALAATNTASATATAANIRNAIGALDDTTLGLVRHTGGLTIDKWITNSWRFYGSYTNEHRDGARPFAAVFGGGGGGGNVEIPETIDYNTQDIIAALRFDDGVNNLNLQAQLSLFKNNTDTLTFENPLYVTPNTVAANAPNVLNPAMFTTGTFDLYPDNTYTNVRAEYARSMPQWYHSRLTATVSLSKYKQDDDLIPWTTNTMQGLNINGVDAYNKWNTPASLTKQSADAEIDTQLYDLGFVMKPTEKVDLNAKIRYYKTDNKTEFFACNPLTGQWGRMINDGSGGAFATPNLIAGNNPVGTTNLGYNATGCNLGATEALGLVPAAGNVNIRNIPFQYSKLNYELGGEYRIARGQSINAKLEREQYDRDYREREKTWENMVKLGYVNRAFQFGTLRVSGEYGQRRGDAYVADPYEAFYSASLGPLPTAATTGMQGWIHAANSFRKYDLADRDRLALDLRLDLIALHDLDVGISGQYRDNKYPDSDLGRTDHQTLGSITLDANWQPSSKLGITGWYTYQASAMNQYGLQANACALGSWYFFYSDGFVGTSAAVNAVAPARAGATLVNTRRVTAGNWQGLCENPAATSPLYPDSRMWQVENNDRNQALGLNARYDFGFARMELDGTYIKGVTSVGYAYNPSALAQTVLTQNLAGLSMPDQNYNQQIINFNVVFPVSKMIAIRALYRYEQGSIDDWHYAGVDVNPVPTLAGAQAVYLDAGSQGYHTNTVGLLVQVNF